MTFSGNNIQYQTKIILLLSTAPLFVFQWLFDEAQMSADHVGTPVTKKQWDFIHDTGIALRASLDNVTAVFAPSCVGHAVMTRKDWLDIRIDEFSLPEAIRRWEINTARDHVRGGSGDKIRKQLRRKESEYRRRQNERHRRKLQIHQEQQERQLDRRRLAKQKRKQHVTTEWAGSARNLQYGVNGVFDGKTEHPRVSNLDTRRQRIERYSSSTTTKAPIVKSNNSGNKSRNHGIRKYFQNDSIWKQHHISNQFSKHQRKERRRQNDRRRRQKIDKFQKIDPCNFRLLERCSWPQCNQSCPNLTNPLTGKEMRFLELMSSFGLDIEAFATALGVDMTTLSNMDLETLLNMLTDTPKS